MIDIEKYWKQVQNLQACVNNLKSAINNVDGIGFHGKYTVEDLKDAEDQVERCHQTLIGQLKLMNIQNEEELKS